MEYKTHLLMKNLKERQDYIDLYDRFTVEECRRIESSVTAEDIQRIAEKQEIKDKYDSKGLATCVNEVHIWCYQGERYKNKDTVITEWMDRDRKMDNCYENAVAPKVSCII